MWWEAERSEYRGHGSGFQCSNLVGERGHSTEMSEKHPIIALEPPLLLVLHAVALPTCNPILKNRIPLISTLWCLIWHVRAPKNVAKISSWAFCQAIVPLFRSS